MKYVFTILAGEHERFASGAFDGAIGKRVPLTVDGDPGGDARLIAAYVNRDGKSASLIVDTGEQVIAAFDWGRIESYSLAFQPYP